jgi:hypothetical protein
MTRYTLRPVGSGVFCVVLPGFTSRGQENDSGVLSLQLEVGRHIHRRSSQTVTSGGGVRDKGAPIAASRCVATPSRVVREALAREDRSRETRKLRDLRRWECSPATIGKDTAD